MNNNMMTYNLECEHIIDNLDNGYINWSKNIPSKNTPIVDDNHVFTVSDSGYFVNLDREKGEIIWSTNILKILKKKL